ncbi:hypothetical protein GGE65_001648 [Skermanella aerolata]|uniref:hypothetical protein n=1 Tax=Skermanella aerolata TaxID=393310 RepID=UPI003D1E97A1
MTDPLAPNLSSARFRARLTEPPGSPVPAKRPDGPRSTSIRSNMARSGCVP